MKTFRTLPIVIAAALGLAAASAPAAEPQTSAQPSSPTLGQPTRGGAPGARRGRGVQFTQPRVSPHDVISRTFDGQRDNRVTIIYGRPFTRSPQTGEPRTIWGGLVPWGQRWRLGADEATLLITQKTLVFGQTEIPAGAYSLFMIPMQEGPSKLLVNKQIGQWGEDPYDQLQEIAQINLTRETLDQPVDQLTITLSPNQGGGGILRIAWENLAFSAPFTIKP